MPTDTQVVYLHQKLPCSNPNKLGIKAQLELAQNGNHDFKIIELDDITQNQCLVFTGYPVGAIQANAAYVGFWWAFDACMVLLSVYPAGSTKIEFVSNEDDLQHIKNGHAIGTLIADFLNRHVLFTKNGILKR